MTQYRGILEIIHQIMKISDKVGEEGSCIYRGEARSHLMASSGLYRAYANKNVKPLNIEDSQKSILDKIIDYLPDIARDLSSEDSQSSSEDSQSSSGHTEILAQLQHYGAITNLIDFTTDYLIALFFACEKEPNRDGRVIMLKRNDENYKVLDAPRTINRAKSQKSVFVQSPTGFIEPRDVVRIPQALKQPILEYLRKYHDISTNRVYDDIHGFIKSADTEPHHLEIHKAAEKKEEWNKLRDTTDGGQEEQNAFNEVVACYETALGLDDEFLEGYLQLANFYFQAGKYDESIETYSKAISLEGTAELLIYRGKAYNYIGKNNKAIEDYDAAIQLEKDNVLYRYERCQILMMEKKWKRVESDITAIKELYEGKEQYDEDHLELEGHLKRLAKFAEEEGIKLPEYIKKMLESADE